jgi:hypothetical protein
MPLLRTVFATAALMTGHAGGATHCDTRLISPARVMPGGHIRMALPISVERGAVIRLFVDGPRHETTSLRLHRSGHSASAVLSRGALARLGITSKQRLTRLYVTLEAARRRAVTGCVTVISRAERRRAHGPQAETSPAATGASHATSAGPAPALGAAYAQTAPAGSLSGLAAVGSAGLAPGPDQPSKPRLRWAPPGLSNPTTIVLQSGLDPDHVSLSPSRDYILKIPAGGLDGTLEIDGGHNVELIGGEITVPATANQSDNGADDTDTGIYIHGSTGVVHIEGLLIDAQPNTQFDGIDIDAPQAVVQLENVRVTNVWGSDTTMHADVVQTWGGVDDLRIDRLSADGDYQGLTLNPDLGPVNSAEVENVDLTLDPRPTALAATTVGGGYMMWLTKGTTTCQAPGAVSLDDVYVNNLSGRVPSSNTVWPPSQGTTLPCAGALSNGLASWPHLAVTGGVTLGARPSGPFVPEGIAGNAYASPGYVGSSVSN